MAKNKQTNNKTLMFSLLNICVSNWKRFKSTYGGPTSEKGSVVRYTYFLLQVPSIIHAEKAQVNTMAATTISDGVTGVMEFNIVDGCGRILIILQQEYTKVRLVSHSYFCIYLVNNLACVLFVQGLYCEDPRGMVTNDLYFQKKNKGNTEESNLTRNELGFAAVKTF